MRRIGALTVYEGLEELPAGFGPSVVTIGVFDGVHRGHQALMREVVTRSDALDATPVVVTFDRHPLEVLNPPAAPALITTLPQRARVIERLGVRALVVLRFDDYLRLTTPQEFIERILVDRLGCVHVVVGADFRFGYRQAGTVATLNELGKTHGFATTIYDLQTARDDQIVSSSLIRKHLTDGLVELVAEELDRPFRVEGTVERGAGRGRGLGFPTANLAIPSRVLLPKLGVYAGWMIRRGHRSPVVMNVGVNPTFGDRDTPILEVHVLDFDEDLYGEVVEIEFTHRLRDEVRFDSVDDLVAQMTDDVARARELLAT